MYIGAPYRNARPYTCAPPSETSQYGQSFFLFKKISTWNGLMLLLKFRPLAVSVSITVSLNEYFWEVKYSYSRQRCLIT